MTTMTDIQDAYLVLIGNYLAEKLNSEGLDINVSVHRDYYYTEGVDCDISLVFITGPIQQKFNRFPIQVIVEVEDRFKDDIQNVLFDMACDLNETLQTLANVKYRLYFNTPSVTQKFSDVGVRRRATLTVEASIIKFESVMDCDIWISIDDSNYESIAYTTLAVSYVADLSSSGAMTSDVIKQTAQTSATTYTVSFVPRNDRDLEDTLVTMMNTNTLPNTEMYLKINMKSKSSPTYIITCVCQSASYSKDYSGFPMMTLALMRGAAADGSS